MRPPSDLKSRELRNRYLKRDDGSRVLLEIRFEGMSKVLVFSKPS